MMQVNNNNKNKKADSFKYKNWEQYDRIKHVMNKKKIRTMAVIADEIAEQKTHVVAAIWGIPGRQNKRIEMKIAQFLGESWDSLFCKKVAV